MKKLILLLLLSSIASSYYAFAEEEIPVNIKADNLRYIEGTNIVTASGSVEVKFDKITIRSDSLTMDTISKIVTAEGNVKMYGLGYDSECSALTYSISNETSSYSGFKTVLSPSNVKGNLYLKAGTISDELKRMTGKEGSVTTCDYTNPHYITMAKRVEYYPNDKIIGYSATLYMVNAPVFWMPIIIYDLKGRQRRNWSFGHNDVEGDFLKTSWDYPSGQIFLDEMSKKGFGHGLTYNYNQSKIDGKIYLYHLEEADTHLSDWVTKINHNIGITDKTTLGLAYTLSKTYQVPSGRLDQSTYSMNFNSTGDKRLTATVNAYDNRLGNQENLNAQVGYSTGALNTNYSINLDQGKADSRYIRLSERFSHSQPLFSDSTRLNFNAAYYNNIQSAGQQGNELLEPNLDITNQGSFYNLRFHENWHLDLDRDLYKADSTDQFLETQPELTLNLNPLDLKLFNLSSNFGYGWYHEVKFDPNINRNRDYATGRYKASLSANKNIPLGLGTGLGIGIGLDQFLYDPGDAMNAFREDASLNSQGYDFFRNNLNYTRGISDGNSPFYFDKFSTKYESIRDTMTLYYQNYFNWMNTCGYNYATKKYFNYDTNMTINPIKPLNFNFRSGFDIENQKYLDLSSGIRIVPWEQFSSNINMVNDLNVGGIKYGNMLIDLETGNEEDWGNHWHFKYGYVYEPSSKQLQLRDIMIVKDLHCWSVTYTYSDLRKEVTMMFTLKAFPGDPLGYNTGRGFYFDTFEKALKEETGQASPVRY